jgi:glucokinase
VAEVIDPEVFVIGGGIAGAGEIILRIVHKYYRPDVLPAGADIPFELARLGNDAGMYGSMKLLLDSSDEK